MSDFINAYRSSRKIGYSNINIDLIYAMPDQTIKNWKYTLNKTISCQPEHISAYSLSYECGTQLHKKVLNGMIKPLSESNEAKFFRITHQILKKHKYLN